MDSKGGLSHFSSGVIPQVSGEDIADFDAIFSGVSLQSLVAPAVGTPFPPLPMSFHYLTEKQRFAGEPYETYRSNAYLDSGVSGNNAVPKKPKLESVSELSTHSLPPLPLSSFSKPKLESETTESETTHSLPPLPLSFIYDSFLHQLPLLDSANSTQKLNLVDSVEAPPPPPPPMMIRPRSNLARQRRQTVSEKIRCLQKLMPWDKKMPIAKMLEEAYKYVRFLEAQIKALKSMPCYSSQTLTLTEEGCNSTDLVKLNRQQLLEVLMNSPAGQTTMYSKGCCVVSAEQLVLWNMNTVHYHAHRNWNNSISNDNVGGGYCEGNSSGGRVSFV